MTIFSMLLRWFLAILGYGWWINLLSNKIHPIVNGEWYFKIFAWFSFGLGGIVLWLAMFYFLMWILGIFTQPAEDAMARLDRKLKAMRKQK